MDRDGIPTDAESPAELSTRAIRWWNRIIVQRHVQGLSQVRGPPQLQEGPDPENSEAGSALLSNSSNGPIGISNTPPQPDTATNILVVSHGGLICTLVVGLLGNQKVRCAEGVVVGRCMNTAISVVEMHENGKGILVSFGDTTHLEGKLVEVNVDVLGDSNSRT